MKIPWLKIAQVVAEVVIDAVTGKLERRAEPPFRGYTKAETEIMSKAAREAGPACTLPPPGWRCTRYKGHAGPCAAVPVKR
jgi:hypothetical protein